VQVGEIRSHRVVQLRMGGIDDAIEFSTPIAQPAIETCPECIGDGAYDVELVAPSSASLDPTDHLALHPGAPADVGLAQVLADPEHAKGVAEADIVHPGIVADDPSLRLTHRFAGGSLTVGIERVAIMESQTCKWPK